MKRYILFFLLVALGGSLFAQSNFDREALRKYLQQNVQKLNEKKLAKKVASATFDEKTLAYLSSVGAVETKSNGDIKFIGIISVDPSVAVISDVKEQGMLRVVFTTSGQLSYQGIDYNATFIWTAKELETKGKKNVSGGEFFVESIRLPFATYMASADEAYANEAMWHKALADYQKARNQVSTLNFEAGKRCEANISTIYTKYNQLVTDADDAYDNLHFAQAQMLYQKAQRIEDNTYLQNHQQYIRVLLAAQQSEAKAQREIARVSRSSSAKQMSSTLGRANILCNEIDEAMQKPTVENVRLILAKYQELQPILNELSNVKD